jgi:hypothetical protein
MFESRSVETDIDTLHRKVESVFIANVANEKAQAPFAWVRHLEFVLLVFVAAIYANLRNSGSEQLSDNFRPN